MISRHDAHVQRTAGLCALAALLLVTAGAAPTSAQTVVVRSAAPGAKVSVTLHGATMNATADSFGDATLAASGGPAESAVQIHVDTCGNEVHVLLLGPGPTSGADPGCTRKELWGVYIARPITTFVVEMNGTDASVFVSQGPPPPSWISRGDNARTSGLVWGKPANGLALTAGTGFTWFGNAAEGACGNVGACDSRNFGVGFTLGAEVWLKNFAPFFSYARPADVTVSGSGDQFRFESRLTTRIVMVGAKVGAAKGPARIYGLFGLDHHQATSTTTQVNSETTVDVGGVMQTIPGGTQSFGQRTDGWSWVAGGGVEAWLSRWIAIYGELTRPVIKGSRDDGGDGAIDDHATLIFGGVRLRLGR